MWAHSTCGVEREPWLWDSRLEEVGGEVRWLLHLSVGDTEKPVRLVQGETAISWLNRDWPRPGCGGGR